MRFFSALILILFFLSGCTASREAIVQDDPIPIQPIKVKEYGPDRGPSKLIVIDPGHGGEDFGTHSLSKPQYHEKSLNLAASKMLRDILKQMGYQTVMTREDDRFIPLLSRATFANAHEPSLFVSVHFNSAPSRDAQGIEVYYYNSDKDKKRTLASKSLAELALNNILANTEAKSRGVKHGDFAVIRETMMPAILVEGGFLTNDEEMQKIKDPVYLKKLVLGIAQGIDVYIRRN